MNREQKFTQYHATKWSERFSCGSLPSYIMLNKPLFTEYIKLFRITSISIVVNLIMAKATIIQRNMKHKFFLKTSIFLNKLKCT